MKKLFIIIALIITACSLSACVTYEEMTAKIKKAPPVAEEKEAPPPVAEAKKIPPPVVREKKAPPPVVREKEDNYGKNFAGIAEELLSSLREPFKIGIQPFRQDDIPVSTETSRRFNDSLMNALMKRGGNKHTFIERADLAKIARENEYFNYDEADLDDLLSKAGIDLLIVGKIYVVKDGVRLSYKCMNRKNGAVLSTSAQHFFALDLASRKGVPLDVAIRKGARHFASLSVPVKKIKIKGLRYQDTGVQTSFGKYFSRGLLDALGGLSGGLETEQARLSVGQIEKLAKVRGHRGVKMTAKKIDDQIIKESQGEFLFQGTYWDLGETVDTRLSFKNKEGKTFQWQAYVKKDSIPPTMALQPGIDTTTITDNDNLGPIGIFFSSDKGVNPVYHIGEKMNLIIQTSQDAYLYIFYKQANGEIFKIFPNKFVKSAKLAGNFLHKIPGKLFAFDLTVSKPTGVEIIKCFVLDKEVASYLTREIAANEMQPIPNSLDQLIQIFRGIPDVKISEATLVVNVEE